MKKRNAIDSLQGTSLKFKQVPDRYISAPREKDYFGTIYKALQKNHIKKVLDIGTASGDFLYYMPEEIYGFGVDTSKELIDVAQETRNKPNLSFGCVDILTQPIEGHFDAITILGTLLALLDFRKVLDICFSLKPRLIIVNDYFNLDGIDIRLGYRSAENLSTDFNFGYNVISKASMETFLNSRGKTYLFEKYDMTTTLKKSTSPMFNYHINVDGERVLTNGSGLILRGFNLYINC